MQRSATEPETGHCIAQPINLLFKRHAKGVVADAYTLAFEKASDMPDEAARAAMLDEVHALTRSVWQVAKDPLGDAAECRKQMEVLFRLLGGSYEAYCAENGTTGEGVDWSSGDES